MAKNKIDIQIKATDKVGKVTRDVEKHLGRVGRATEGLKKRFTGLGKAIKVGLVAGAAAMTAAVYTVQRVVRDSISAASALEEVTNKFNVVFKDQTEQAEKWADALRDSYLMSRREAREYLSSIQDLLVPMGMASNQAGKLSFGIVKLAADLGSFNNLPTAQVMSDIQSAMVGNYETMKKYGVVLTAAAVQQRALDMGLAKNKDALTVSQKAQAAYNIMMKNSAAAIGDVARSSGSYANQVKQYKANLEDLRVVIGNALLPTVTDIVSKMNEWVKANEVMIQQRVPEYITSIGKAAKFAGSSLAWWLSPSKRTGDKLVRQITDLEEELKRLESWEPNFLNKFFGQEKDYERIEEVRAKIAQLKAELEALWVKQGEIITPDAKKVADDIKKGADAIEKTGEGLEYILEGVKKVVGEGEEARGTFTHIKNAADKIPGAIKKGIEKVEAENELYKKQITLLEQKIRLIQQAAREPGATSHEGGTTLPYTMEGMRYGGPVLRRQEGGAVPGYGGGDRIPGLLEPGEFVIRKEAVRSLGTNMLNALNRGGGTQGYFVLDHRFEDGKAFPLTVTADEVGKAFMEYLEHGRKTKGNF